MRTFQIFQVQTKSFDDDFDSDADDDVPEPSAKKPSTAVKDESEDDSDFEDPDLIEIPGEIKTLKSGESAQSMPSFDGRHLNFFFISITFLTDNNIQHTY